MKSQNLKSLQNLENPLFYFDKGKILTSVQNYSDRNFLLNYSVKACLFEGLTKILDPFVDGFSVSSIQELKDVRKETKKPCHFVSPLIRDQEIDFINKYANSVAFNSLEQLDRLKDTLDPYIDLYLRVNPETSLIKDDKYNPCRPFSKLGIPLKDLKIYLQKNNLPSNLGLHFHNACQEEEGKNLICTLNKIKETLGDSFSKFQSINIGGGYLFSKENFDIWQNLKEQYDQEITLEPGFDLINSSGYLISSVADIFKRDGKNIVVLNTSTNHLSEVFEYQYSPEILKDLLSQDLKHSYLLTGATCLAGDIFGEYSFKEDLEVGSLIVFQDVGAYSIVKMNQFNGISTPQIIIDDFPIEKILEALHQKSSSKKDIKRDFLLTSHVF